MNNFENSVILRRTDLAEAIGTELGNIPVSIASKDNRVLVSFNEILICGTVIEDEGYQIYNASAEWKEKTTYLCEDTGDGTWHYYLETIDEVIGEVKRLVMFEDTKRNQTSDPLYSMRDALKQIDSEKDVDKKYSRVIALLKEYKIPLQLGSPSHIKDRYRILEDGSSIFVYANRFKINMCNTDKMLIEKHVGLTFVPLYKNKKDMIRDNVRPWQTEFNDVETLGKIIFYISSKKEY